RDVPADRAAADDAREDVHVGERHRILGLAPVEPEVKGGRDRQHEQRQEHQGVAETHPPPPAQIAPTWIIPDPRPALARTLTVLRCTDVFVDRLETSAALGGVAVENPRAAYQPTSRSSARHEVTNVD